MTAHPLIQVIGLRKAFGGHVVLDDVSLEVRAGEAVALLGRPPVLLLDEPFAGIDQRAGKWLDGHLGAFKAAGSAILMTTHRFGRGLGVADRIAILAAGRVAHDTPLGALTLDDVRRLYELHAEDGA